MIIVGAGQAGLLAARRLAHYDPVVIEQQETLPNNHGALLRFKTNEIGKAVGIDFKKVNVYKGVLCEDGYTITNSPTLRDFNAYSNKTTNRTLERSIINIHNAIRFVAPIEFISNIARGTSITYGKSFSSILYDRSRDQEVCISTIPMLALMDILAYPNKPQFDYLPIWSINCIVEDAEVYQTLYVPYNIYQPYRVSITGNIMTLEFSRQPCHDLEQIVLQYLKILGINSIAKNITLKEQNYGKIVPIDNNARQQFILWATDQHNIYSLGRYGTWRQILLDDVLQDIAVIERMISQRSHYNRRLQTSRS